ncbi:MAG: ROK family protein [Gammaproteobacteria bacterium]|nr:ROK family protein [Gammaproteobacteria bacterium]
MRIGIDLGGTKIEIIVLKNNGQEVFRQRVDTPQGDYAQTLSAVVQLVEQTKTHLLQHVMSTSSEKLTIGIGIPGAVSLKTGLIKNANSVCLIGQPLQADLQRKLGQSVRINNDANCFTVSEATDGAAAGCEVVFGVIIGTGTGGGIAIQQQVINGVNAIAGEWGHNPMPWLSKSELDVQPVPCYCGQYNCIETFLSGPGMLQRFRQSGSLADSPQEIAERANSGDKQAEQFMTQYDNWLAKGLASIINILDPDAIVLGGGLSNIDRLYRNVPKLWQHYVFSDQVNTRLLKAKYGDSSGVRGAAWLWPAEPG